MIVNEEMSPEPELVPRVRINDAIGTWKSSKSGGGVLRDCHIKYTKRNFARHA
jgi:hypothetical protein